MYAASRLLRTILTLFAVIPFALPAQGRDPLATLRARRSPAPLDNTLTAFTHVRVLPMTGEAPSKLDDQNVLVRNGRIEAMGPATVTRVPVGARQIDGRGMTLLPGLADVHIHLRYLDHAAENPRLLELLLANGVTTAMNMLGLPEHLTLRAAIDSGRVLGPVLYTSGFYVSEPFVHTPGQVDSAVRAQRAAGYDMIKIHGELFDSAFRALFVAARREGIPVVGHAVHALGLTALLDEHQYQLSHVEEYLYAWFGFNRRSPLPADSVRPLLDEAARLTKAAGMWVSPTLVVFQHIVPQITAFDSVMASPDIRRLPPGMQAEWKTDANPYINRNRFPPELVEAYRGQSGLLSMQTAALQKAGVKLVLGTDAGVPGTSYGFSVHDELTALVAAGLTPWQAIRAATANAAEFLAAGREFGTIVPGLRADLLLVRGDPLVDVGVLRTPEGVMVRGRWIPRAGLDRMLAGETRKQ